MNERQQRFIDLLKQIFEIDKADLDFGIYRILNIRRNEIQDFFTNKLPQEITEILTPFATGGKEEIRTKMAAIEQQAASFGVSAENNPEYKELKAQLQQGTDLSALESDVYSALYSFFSRYYDEGDFISKRRYKEGVYAIPYEGEEVKLYWANQDQYYIKTAENFKDYTFKSDSYTVHFRLVDATTEQNNNKETDDKKRRFMIFTEDEENYPGIKTFETNEIKDKDGKVVEREYIVRFIYDVPEDQKAKWDEINYITIHKNLLEQPDTQLKFELLCTVNPDAKKADQITLIQKHLKGYVAKNTFDYFIHKDLGGFLTRELDFFIKNEIMHLDDLDTANEARVNTYLAKVRAIKRVGKTIIAFLAQLENFQKKLWLKKKFVVETNWCITLDRIDEKFYDEIRQNKAQVQEWIDMYAIDEIEPDLEHTEPWTDVPSITFLKQNQNLIVDTKHFSDEFKNKLVANIDNLDEETGGLMIKSENLHALGLLHAKYAKSVKCVYIDPPYNTGSDGFVYKDDYLHSTWLSMMNDRLLSAKSLMQDLAPISVSINENELFNLKNLMDSVFEGNYYTTLTVKVRHEDRILKGDKDFHEVYENVLFYSKSNQFKPLKRHKDNTSIDDYKFTIETSEIDELLELGGKSVEVFHPNHYQIKRMSEPSADYLKPISVRGSIREGNSSGRFYVGYLEGLPKNYAGCLFKVPNMGDDQYGFRYFWIPTIESGRKNGDYYQGKPVNGKDIIDIPYPNYIDFESAFNDATNEGGVAYRNGKKPLAFMNHILGLEKIDEDKNGIVLDFFAGSASTGHSVILSNQKDEGNRKYILVQLGDIFENVTKVRMKNSIYSSSWKDGKPLSRNEGYSHIMKYLRLESYEDALSNVSLKAQPVMHSLFGDDYLINYMLDLEAKESLLNLKAFKTPFEYEMRITEKNECKEQRVDVCETFNYLIGLTVVRQGEIKYFNAKAARNPEYEGAVDLVSDKNGSYAFRQIEGTLRDGRRVLIIWRNISDNLLESNGALDAYFTKYRINPLDREYDVIYVNGDSNLENLRTDDESWKVIRTETEFNKRMFEEE